MLKLPEALLIKYQHSYTDPGSLLIFTDVKAFLTSLAVEKNPCKRVDLSV